MSPKCMIYISGFLALEYIDLELACLEGTKIIFIYLEFLDSAYYSDTR